MSAFRLPSWSTSARWRRTGVGLLALLAVGVIAGGGIALRADDAVAQPPAPVITITGFAYGGALTVPAGAVVTVRNNDRAPHTLTAVDRTFTTATIPGGQSATFTAPTVPGTYAITCLIHGSMSGTLIVTEPPAPTDTPSPSATPDPTPTVTPTPPAPPVITVSNFAYEGDLTVPAGATVTVTNIDATQHTLTAVDGSFTTADIAPGASETFVAPTEPGIYEITCQVHGFMSGILTVTAAGTATPDPGPTGTPPAIAPRHH